MDVDVLQSYLLTIAAAAAAAAAVIIILAWIVMGIQSAFGGGANGKANSCETCRGDFGELFSLGGKRGGYGCQACGMRSCDRCCGAKGLEVGRMTMICPGCGSDQMQVFRIEEADR